MSAYTELHVAFVKEASKLRAAKTFTDVQQYADGLGNILSNLLCNEFEGVELTDDVINAMIKPLLTDGYTMSSNMAARVQRTVNNAAGIAWNPVQPDLKNVERINNLCKKLAEEGNDADWLLGKSPVQNVCKAGAIDTIEKNAERQADAGLTVRVKRWSSGKCCDWCDGVSGSYDLKNVPDGFWSIHKDCSCVIDYMPSKRQWTRVSFTTGIDGRRYRNIENL